MSDVLFALKAFGSLAKISDTGSSLGPYPKIIELGKAPRLRAYIGYQFQSLKGGAITFPPVGLQSFRLEMIRGATGDVIFSTTNSDDLTLVSTLVNGQEFYFNVPESITASLVPTTYSFKLIITAGNLTGFTSDDNASTLPATNYVFIIAAPAPVPIPIPTTPEPGQVTPAPSPAPIILTAPPPDEIISPSTPIPQSVLTDTSCSPEVSVEQTYIYSTQVRIDGKNWKQLTQNSNFTGTSYSKAVRIACLPAGSVITRIRKHYLIDGSLTDKFPYQHLYFVENTTKKGIYGNHNTDDHQSYLWTLFNENLKTVLGNTLYNQILSDFTSAQTSLTQRLAPLTLLRYLFFLENSKIEYWSDKLSKTVYDAQNNISKISNKLISKYPALASKYLTFLDLMRVKQERILSESIYLNHKNNTGYQSLSKYPDSSYDPIMVLDRAGKILGCEVIHKLDLDNSQTLNNFVSDNSLFIFDIEYAMPIPTAIDGQKLALDIPSDKNIIVPDPSQSANYTNREGFKWYSKALTGADLKNLSALTGANNGPTKRVKVATIGKTEYITNISIYVTQKDTSDFKPLVKAVLTANGGGVLALPSDNLSGNAGDSVFTAHAGLPGRDYAELFFNITDKTATRFNEIGLIIDRGTNPFPVGTGNVENIDDTFEMLLMWSTIETDLNYVEVASPPPAPSSPIVRLGFNDGSGSIIADEEGYADCNLTGIYTWNTDNLQIDNSNGFNYFASDPGLFTTLDDFSVILWYEPDTLGFDHLLMIGEDSTSNTSLQFILSRIGGDVYLTTFDPSNADNLSVGGDLIVGQKAFIAVTYKRSTREMVIKMTPNGGTTWYENSQISSIDPNQSANFMLRQSVSGFGGAGKYYLAELYNFVLDSTQIEDLFDAGSEA